MDKNITIIDKDYSQWVKELVSRYRQSQIKAAIQVNSEQLRFNWLLGRDIVEMKVEGLSVTNLRYCRRFYLLYSQTSEIHPQVEDAFDREIIYTIHPQVGGELQLPESQLQLSNILNVPWGHHKLILDKVKGDVDKALINTTRNYPSRHQNG